LVATVATAGTAQVPTTQQAQQMLQNPDLVNQLREQLTTSGLTPDQVRARLIAEGYPPNLLDAYLPGGTANAADSIPSNDVLRAMRALGISGSPAGRSSAPRAVPPRAMPTDTAALRVFRDSVSRQIFGLDVFRSS